MLHSIWLHNYTLVNKDFNYPLTIVLLDIFFFFFYILIRLNMASFCTDVLSSL